jgi:predicted RNA-binding protein YlqC (UPF0109 family)
VLHGSGGYISDLHNREAAVMKELAEFIVKALVDHPENVVLTEQKCNHTVLIELRVAKSDIGKVIGKRGNIINAICILLNSVAAVRRKCVKIEIQCLREPRRTLI